MDESSLPPRICHLALAADWDAAQAVGEYRVSTRGATLEEVGFIHLSFPAQVAATAARYYGGRDDVVLLVIDPERLRAEVKVEGVDGGERFPHLYGPLPLDAVVGIRPWSAGALDDLEADR